MTDPASLQALADRLAITDLLHRYCRAMDRIDDELGYSIWHEDGLAEYEGFYSGTGRGFIDKVCETHRNVLWHSHQVTNIILELDGDRAASEAYMFLAMRVQEGGQLKQIQVWCRYIDRWSRRNGRWGIDKRITICDFDEVRNVTPVSNPNWGRRDRNDPSYAALGEIRRQI
jgi:hypothetical protein